jgi:hypothetical protein
MSEELRTYDFPVDHGDFTTTVELFYLKSDVDERIRSMKQEIGELKDKLRHYPMMVSIIASGNKKITELEAELSELRGGNKDVPASADLNSTPKTPEVNETTSTKPKKTPEEQKLADYNTMLKDIERTAARPIPPDTQVQYIGGVLDCWEERGIQVSMVLNAGTTNISCHLVWGREISVFQYRREEHHDGAQLLVETTLGDKETFFKAWDAVYGNGDASKLFGKS